MLFNCRIRPPVAGLRAMQLSWPLGFFQLARKPFEMRHTLLMIEPFVFVGAQYGIRGDKGTGQIDLAAQFWVPPTVGYADMALLHRVVHGDLREHRALRRRKLRPISVHKTLFLRIRWV